MEITETIDQYLNYCQFQKRLNEKTIKAYRIDLVQFAAFIVNYSEPLHKSNILQYIQEMHLKHKPKTVKRKIASIRSFFNHLEFEEIIISNPIRKMRLEFREPVVLPKHVSLKTIQRLLKTANTLLSEEGTELQHNIRLRNMAILELLFATGLRVSELCSLHSVDINLQNGIIKVWGKGSRERFGFIGNTETLSVLKAHKKANDRKINLSEWFFTNRFGNRLSEQSVRDMINNYAKEAGISEHITPHMIRHTFATLLLEEDVDIRYIQSILGHSSISTTQIYTHVSQRKQNDILKKKHPRNRITI